MTTSTGTITAGFMVRHQIRAVLDLYEVQRTEHKGLTQSVFVVRGVTPQAEDAIREVVGRF